jgi:hypothetical protein
VYVECGYLRVVEVGCYRLRKLGQYRGFGRLRGLIGRWLLAKR